MRIVTSGVSLTSSRIGIATSTVKEHLRQWDKTGELTYDTETFNGKFIGRSSQIKDSVQLPQRPEQPRLLPPLPQASIEKQKDIADSIKEEFVGDIKARIMKDVIEAFIGKKIDVLDPGDLKQSGSDESADVPAAPQQAEANQPEGWGIDYQYSETHYTKEGVAFSASGTVATADGRSIDFKAALEMSRETYDEINISLKAGDALKDPLVIDLAGTGAVFTNTKFDFDLDADGAADRIYAPRTGAGFLAYDRNGNGLVDDGSELFGPRSGNGFSELALLDEDRNGWIDEGDSAFNEMKIWQKDADGNDYVSSLLQSGIGAIYTGRATTAYDLTTDIGNLAGALRESGVYLKENGGAGVVQEVDLVI